MLDHDLIMAVHSAQVPTPARGTEDYMKVGETIWSYAWDAATLGHAPATKFDAHTAGLAIVGPSLRKQHQARVRAI